MSTINYANAIVADGTADAMTATVLPVAILTMDLLPLYVRVPGSNTTTTPVIDLNGSGSKLIIKGVGDPLAAGDMTNVAILSLDIPNDRYVLLNPQPSSGGGGSQSLVDTLTIGAKTGSIPITSDDELKSLKLTNIKAILGATNVAEDKYSVVSMDEDQIDVISADDTTGKSSSIGLTPNGIFTSSNDGGDNYSSSTFTDSVAQIEAGGVTGGGYVNVVEQKTTASHDVLIELNAPSVTKNGDEIATEDYVNQAVVGLLDDRGNYNPSTNSNQYPTTGGSGTAGVILKGDLWTIAGLGAGVSALMGAISVTDGDTVRALSDTPGQTAASWATAETNIGYSAENQANKSTSVITDQASNVKYSTAKSVYDFVIGLGYLAVSVAASTYVSLTGSYVNPSWITSLAWSKITGTPTTLSGYGITDAAPLNSQLKATDLKASTYAIQVGEFVPFDSTAGAIAFSLPANPADGSISAAKRMAGTFNGTVTAGGSDVFNLAGGSTTATISLANQQLTFIYKKDAVSPGVGIWYVETSLSLGSLDSRYARIIGKNYTPASGTNTTSEELLMAIPCSPVLTDDNLEFYALLQWQNTANAKLFKLYISPTALLSDVNKIQVAQTNQTSSTGIPFTRRFIVKSSTLIRSHIPATANLAIIDAITTGGNVPTDITVPNMSAGFYILISCTKAVGTESNSVDYTYLKRS